MTAPEKISALWFLPTFGDGRYLGSPESARAGDFPYLKQIALAADSLGFEGVLIPTGRRCEDSWLLASALAPLHRAAQVSRRRAAGRALADAGRAHDGDARSALQRPRADQCRLRRRSAGESRRRPVLAACASAIAPPRSS